MTDHYTEPMAALDDSHFLCRSCGEHHTQILCLGPDAPALVDRLPAEARSTRVKLGEELCVVDEEHFFIRGRIVVPIVDHPDPFIWLVWVSLSASNFDRTLELWERPGRESESPYFGWLSSDLPGFSPGTLSLKTHVHTQPVGQRPEIELEPTDHPLAVAQRQGVSLAQVQAWVEHALHA